MRPATRCTRYASLGVTLKSGGWCEKFIDLPLPSSVERLIVMYPMLNEPLIQEA